MKPTQEQVIAWAREVELFATTSILMKFAALAYEAGRKDENDVCTKLVVQCSWNVKGAENALLVDGCAAAIRAMREQ